jgi:sulfate permease, SulP family
VLNYSRIDAVRYALSGRRRKSTVERHPTDERLLREHGSRIYVLALQGYLFFGTTRRLQRYLEQRAAHAEREPLRFAVLDFKQVTGIDPSAIHVFSKIARLAKNKNFELVVTHIGEVFRRQIRVCAVEETALQSLQFLPDLDLGLEWCEERMLQGLSAADTQPAPTVLAEVSRRLPDQARRDTFEGYLERLVLPAGHTLITRGGPPTTSTSWRKAPCPST